MRRTKRYPLCLTCFPQKTRKLSGSRDHGASGHPAGLHVQDPAVSDLYVEPKGGAALCRLTSVLFGPPSGGLRKSVGAGLSSRRLFDSTRSRRVRGLLRSLLSGVPAPPTEESHLAASHALTHAPIPPIFLDPEARGPRQDGSEPAQLRLHLSVPDQQSETAGFQDKESLQAAPVASMPL